MRRCLGIASVVAATALTAFFLSISGARAQLTPAPTATPTPTSTPIPTPTCVGLGCIVTPRPTVAPTREPTPEPTIARTTPPRQTTTPTPSATEEPSETEEPTPRPTATPTPTPIPSPESPNRGLAVLGLFGSGGMLGSAAWIWRRYLS